MEWKAIDVVRALAPLLGDERAAKLDAVARGRIVGVTIVLEDIRDPHNAAAALRSSEAMGLAEVHLVTPRHRFRTSARVTQGCEKWLAIARHADAASCAEALHRRGFRLLGASPDAARTVGELDARERTALCFGNEHTGLSPELRALTDGEFKIPMYGCSQSLNVSVAVAVAVHALTEARRSALGRIGDLDGEALDELRAKYYSLDVREWRKVVARYVERKGR